MCRIAALRRPSGDKSSTGGPCLSMSGTGWNSMRSRFSSRARAVELSGDGGARGSNAELGAHVPRIRQLTGRPRDLVSPVGFPRETLQNDAQTVGLVPGPKLQEFLSA